MGYFTVTAETAKDRRRRATRAEQKICDALGARFTYNSGAGSEKGDGRLYGAYRIEAKSTRTSKYRLTAADWAKLSTNCVHAGETPIFSIDFEQRGLHILVVSCRLIDDTLSYEDVRVQKGVTFNALKWPPVCAEDEVPHQLIALATHSATYFLVAFLAEDLLPQLVEDE